MNSLPYQIYNDVTSPTTQVVNRAWGAALTLVVMILYSTFSPASSLEGAALHEPRRTSPQTADKSPEPMLEPSVLPPPRPTLLPRGPPPSPLLPPAGERRGPSVKVAPEVRFEQLRAFYGSSEQVRGIDLRFPANQVTAIIGPSGCGKSTFLRCLNRMHEHIPGARARAACCSTGSTSTTPPST